VPSPSRFKPRSSHTGSTGKQSLLSNYSIFLVKIRSREQICDVFLGRKAPSLRSRSKVSTSKKASRDLQLDSTWCSKPLVSLDKHGGLSSLSVRDVKFGHFHSPRQMSSFRVYACQSETNISFSSSSQDSRAAKTGSVFLDPLGTCSFCAKVAQRASQPRSEHITGRRFGDYYGLHVRQIPKYCTRIDI
jgi:hypothetical protein